MFRWQRKKKEKMDPVEKAQDDEPSYQMTTHEFAEIGYKNLISIITAQETADDEIIEAAMTDVQEDHMQAVAGLIVASGSMISIMNNLESLCRAEMEYGLDLKQLLLNMREDNLRELHVETSIMEMEKDLRES